MISPQRLLILLAMAFVIPFLSSFAAGPTPPLATTDEPVPVEKSMHEFMEYVFQPTYKRLKQNMAASPEDNQGWKAVKSDALILAESTNLLLHRQPEKSAADWVAISGKVRQTGAQLYQAAKAKNYPDARKAYEAMIADCNACHQQFANGKYQLKP